MRAVFNLLGTYRKDNIFLIWIKEKDFNDIKKIDSNIVFSYWGENGRVYYLLNKMENYKKNTVLLELVEEKQIPSSATRCIVYDRENFIEINTERGE